MMVKNIIEMSGKSPKELYIKYKKKYMKLKNMNFRFFYLILIQKLLIMFFIKFFLYKFINFHLFNINILKII